MNTKMDIQDGQRIDHEDTDLDLPELPGEWSWGTVNHVHWNHKVNVFFGLRSGETGGYLGEIDNFSDDDEEKWSLHVRLIVDVPGDEDRNRPRASAATAETFDTLDDAIDAVLKHIATNYPTEWSEVDA